MVSGSALPLEAALRNSLKSWSVFQWVDPLPLIGATTGGEQLVAGDPLPVNPLAASKASGVHAACWRWSLGACLERCSWYSPVCAYACHSSRRGCKLAIGCTQWF